MARMDARPSEGRVEKGAKDIMSGWNGSGQRGNSAPIQPKVTAKKPSAIRGLVAGLVVVALICVAYFAFFSGGEKPQEEKSGKERGRIKEVTPAPAPKAAETNAAPVVKKPKDPRTVVLSPEAAAVTEDTPLEELPKGVYRAGIAMLNGKRITPRKLFKSKCENIIAGFITTKPGDMMLELPLDANFDQQFVNNMLNKIEIEEGDTPEEAQIKKDFIEVRKQLIERAKNGESVREILLAERKEMNKLASMKNELQRGFVELKKSGASIEEQSDYLKAAEKMLGEKGVSPLHVDRKTRMTLKDLNFDYGDTQSKAEGEKK